MSVERLYNWYELFVALYSKDLLKGMLPVEAFLRAHPLETSDS